MFQYVRSLWSIPSSWIWAYAFRISSLFAYSKSNSVCIFGNKDYSLSDSGQWTVNVHTASHRVSASPWGGTGRPALLGAKACIPLCFSCPRTSARTPRTVRQSPQNSPTYPPRPLSLFRPLCPFPRVSRRYGGGRRERRPAR